MAPTDPRLGCAVLRRYPPCHRTSVAANRTSCLWATIFGEGCAEFNSAQIDTVLLSRPQFGKGRDRVALTLRAPGLGDVPYTDHGCLFAGLPCICGGVPRSADFLVKEFPSCKWQGSSSLPFKSEFRCSIRKAVDRILLWIRRQYVCPKHFYPLTRPHGVINYHNI
jgi:hypothetical protein